MEPKHPIQPFIIDSQGVLRFKKNKIVDFLLDNGGIDLNRLWRLWGSGLFPIEDMEQFYQLIGYSISGFNEMSNFTDETVNQINKLADEFRQQNEKNKS